MGIATVLVVLGVPAPASAHTELVGTTPADGSQLPRAPRTVALEFSGAVDPAFATLVVSVDGGNPSRLRVVAGATPSTVQATVPPADTQTSGQTRWRVDYRVTSVDGHPIQGTLNFSVAPVPRSQEPNEEVVTPSAPPPAAVGEVDAGTQRWVVVAAPLAFAVLALPALLVLVRRRRDVRGARPGHHQ